MCGNAPKPMASTHHGSFQSTHYNRNINAVPDIKWDVRNEITATLLLKFGIVHYYLYSVTTECFN